MKKEEGIKINGYVRLQVKDSNGNLLQDTGFQKNVITNTGLAAIAGLVGNVGSVTAFTYLAVGTDNTAASASQTALVAEVVDSGLARHVATVTRSTTNQTNDTVQFDYTWTATGSKTLNEIGVFNASSTGVMLARKVTTGSISAVNTNVISGTYKVIFS